MGINSSEIKDKTKYDLDNIGYINDFDVNSLLIKKNQELVLIFIILDVLLI